MCRYLCFILGQICPLSFHVYFLKHTSIFSPTHMPEWASFEFTAFSVLVVWNKLIRITLPVIIKQHVRGVGKKLTFCSASYFSLSVYPNNKTTCPLMSFSLLSPILFACCFFPVLIFHTFFFSSFSYFYFFQKGYNPPEKIGAQWTRQDLGQGRKTSHTATMIHRFVLNFVHWLSLFLVGFYFLTVSWLAH